MTVRYFLFLSLGLTRVYPSKGRKYAKGTTEKLLEPQGSRVCRRNILVLSGVVVVAGFAGADLNTLSLFGVKPSGDWGVPVLGFAAILTQLYWFCLRYQRLHEDGEIELDPGTRAPGVETVKISQVRGIRIVWRDADLFSNRVAFGLVLLSWYFMVRWIIEAWR